MKNAGIPLFFKEFRHFHKARRRRDLNWRAKTPKTLEKKGDSGMLSALCTTVCTTFYVAWCLSFIDSTQSPVYGFPYTCFS